MLAGHSIIKGALDRGDWKAYRDGVQISTELLKIGPHSIDVSLGGTFILPRPTTERQLLLATMDDEELPILDPYVEEDFQKGIVWETIEAPYFNLEPGDFVLACVRERFESKVPVAFTTHGEFIDERFVNVPGPKIHVTQCYDGRSTVGRLGVMSHVTAGYGDLGFASNFTLEMHNVNPKLTIRMHRGMRIGQVSFHAVGCTDQSGPLMYSGSYTEQHDKPVAPRLGWKRFVQPGETYGSQP